VFFCFLPPFWGGGGGGVADKEGRQLDINLFGYQKSNIHPLNYQDQLTGFLFLFE